MSEENVEIVRRVYESWARGDFTVPVPFDPEIDFEMVDWPHQSRTRGIDAMWETWRSTLSAFHDFRSIPTEFAAYGANVLVLNRIEDQGTPRVVERIETTLVERRTTCPARTGSDAA